MTKQTNKQHAAASAPSFYGQPKHSNQAYYTTQLSKPSTKATYSCNGCRRRSLACDSHIHHPCTNCTKSNTTQSCTNLPRDSFEVFLPDDPRVRHQPCVPFHQYSVEQGWNLGQRKRAPWETQAQLAPWGSEVLNGRAAGTEEEPMFVTSNMP